MRRALMTAAVGGSVLAASLLMAPIAFADDHGKEHGKEHGVESKLRDRGTCSLTSTYKAELENKHGSQKVKFEVKSAVAGESWQLDLVADDVAQAPLTAISELEDHDDDANSAEAEFKTYLNPAATTVSFLATNATTNETCSATLSTADSVTTPVADPTQPVSSPASDPVSDPSTGTTSTTTTSSAKKISRATVAQHASTSDCWSIVGKNVYDLTSYVSQHPGGSGAIAGICGANGTAAFKSQHMGSSKIASILAAYKIGKVKK